MKPGSANDGYWTLAHAVIQFENFADCCKVMYPGKDILVSYNNSANHRGKRANGFDVKRMDKNFGGAQHGMRQSTIMEAVLGEYDNPLYWLAPGAIQLMNFSDGKRGPYWMTKAEQELNKFNPIFLGQSKQHKRTKQELAAALRDTLDTPPNNLDKKSLAHLKLLAQRHGIETVLTISQAKEGWMDKPKGLLQICCKWGLIKGWIHMKAYAKRELQELLGKCDGFKNKISLLEWVAENRGIKIIFSAKGYPDTAGFGIEYDWACGKNRLSSMPLADRKGAERFKVAFDHTFWMKL
jgi:hypothetical protein